MNIGPVILLHNRVANAAWLFMAIVAVWSLINYARGKGLEGNFLGAVVVGELLLVAQAILGLIMLLSGLFPPRIIHFLYGTLSVLVFPALWAYTRGDVSRRASLIWGLGGLAMVGLTLRAMGTGA